MKKIRVIELLNKIYENLDVPKRVKLNTYTFEYCKKEQDFYDKEHSTFLICDYAQSHSKWLEVEVEILEDEDKIDIQELEDVNLFDNGQNFNDMPIIIKSYDDNFTNINNTINKLVKSVKQLDKKINKEE